PLQSVGHTIPLQSCRTKLDTAGLSFRKAERYKASLNPRVPLVALVFPIATLAPGDALEALDQFDAHDIFGMLVTKLSLDPQTDRRAVGDREYSVVHLIGQDGLRVIGILGIETFIIVLVILIR